MLVELDILLLIYQGNLIEFDRVTRLKHKVKITDLIATN